MATILRGLCGCSEGAAREWRERGKGAAREISTKVKIMYAKKGNSHAQKSGCGARDAKINITKPVTVPSVAARAGRSACIQIYTFASPWRAKDYRYLSYASDKDSP